MSSGGENSGGHGQDLDFDINLAPIIDCFTVLITFLLASASFLAIGVFESNVAIPGPANGATKPPPVRVDIELGLRREIIFKVSGAAKIEKTIPSTKGGWDVTQLMTEIAEIQKKWPETTSTVLTAADDVEYVHIVRLMESIRVKVPNILLEGY